MQEAHIPAKRMESSAPPEPLSPSAFPALGSPGEPATIRIHPAPRRKQSVHRHSPAQIPAILRAIHASGKRIPEACGEHQITLATYYRWRKFAREMGDAIEGGMGADDATTPSTTGAADSAGPAFFQPQTFPPSPESTAEHPAHAEREAHHLRDTIVQLAMENITLKRHNTALLEALAQRPALGIHARGAHAGALHAGGPMFPELEGVRPGENSAAAFARPSNLLPSQP